ncbi:MAG TPA: hypothetical protein PK405_00660 [Hyphomicrobiales bacterium]|nr:hypothetical protein [Rhodobiaceae bacterium]HXK53173.1 hypothetical protein [Hyphomicrobiales bacterium]
MKFVKKRPNTKRDTNKPVDALEAKYKKVGIHAVEAAAKYINNRPGRTRHNWLDRRNAVAG